MTDRLQLPSGFSEGEVVLRSATVADVERITEICQDSDIQRFTRVPVPYTRDDAQGFVDTATEAPQNGRGAQLLVEADGTVTGCVGLGIDWTDRLGIIGYWTAPEARRRGITTTAVRMVCRWVLTDLGLGRIELDTAATNAASNALARSLGFRLEGTRRSAILLSPAGAEAPVRVDANDWGLLPGELT